MKKFIRNTTIAVLLFTTVVFMLFFVFRITSNSIHRNATDKIFLFGNSHGATAIYGQPKIGTLQTVTLAKSAQSLFWTIKGIEKTIKQNKCSYILIELTNNSFTTNFWTYDKTRLLSEKDKIYQLSMSDWKYLFSNNPTKTAKLFCTLPLPTFNTSGTFESKIGFAVKEDLKNNGERIKVQHIEITEQDVKNRKRIYQIIAQHPEIKFIVFRAPMHYKYFDVLGKSSQEEFLLETFEQLSSYKNCSVLDFGHYYQEDSLFYDLDHLNINGSKQFTAFFIPKVESIINNK